ncbi:MAG: GTPase ObgE [Proteobacteria bacterium]|nr:GTPase ObgE [Pseudomonadota bacterium]MBQ4359266.1 GTPase ObgE [Pseudomonadota bacterium]
MRFVDEIKIETKAGKGGDGAATFRREMYVPQGGPNGGDGGKGGDVILEGDDGFTTLSHLRYKRFWHAKNGVPGGKNKMHGKNGSDCTVKVPVGTIIFDDTTGDKLGDITTHGQKVIVCKGGRGGRGNPHFATATNRSPHLAERGRSGEEKTLRLEMKMLADVGLLGFPSVGKSTFISTVSNAKPKIADYPFTTLVPNLGVVPVTEDFAFVIADVPGLIVGASEGKGLGLDFLKHLERTRILIHLIEVTPQLEGAETDRDPLEDFKKLNIELKAFSEALSEKQQIVVLSKCDEPWVEARKDELRAEFENMGYEFHAISCQNHEGIRPLLLSIARHIKRARAAEKAEAEAAQAALDNALPKI